MNTYDAIMAAADHIERFPASYNFCAGMVPRGPTYENDVVKEAFGPGGYPCCMLARIGCYIDERYMDYGNVASHALRLAPDTFYRRIAHITARQAGADPELVWPYPFGSDRPLKDPKTVPAAMRAYAREYHGIPAAVKQIFECGTVEKAFSHA